MHYRGQRSAGRHRSRHSRLIIREAGAEDIPFFETALSGDARDDGARISDEYSRNSGGEYLH